MITEDYVSFETAKLLKKKGFENDAISCINVFKGHIYKIQDRVINADDDVTIPTLQMAMKWLREEKNLHLDITAESFDDKVLYRIETILRSGENHRWFAFEPSDESGGLYPFYEEACEAAIKYCLENLI